MFFSSLYEVNMILFSISEIFEFNTSELKIGYDVLIMDSEIFSEIYELFNVFCSS